MLSVDGDGCGFHAAPYRYGACCGAGARLLWTMCSTGFPVARRTRSTRSARSQPDFVSANVEITMSSTRKYWSVFKIAVYGSGSPIIPAAYRPRTRSRSSTSLRRVRARRVDAPSPPSWGISDQEQLALVDGRLLIGLRLQRLEQLVAGSGAVRDRQRDVKRQAFGVDVGDDVRDGQPGGVLHPLDQVAPEPARARLRDTWR